MTVRKNKFKYLSNNRLLFIANLVLLLIIFLLSFLLLKNYKENNKDIITRDKGGDFKLINPILDCEESSQDANSIVPYYKISHEVNNLKYKYKVNNVSLYFRDLNNGPWVGINEKAVFSPASLLKTPVVMALFKYAEDNPDILKKKVLISKSDIQKDINQNIAFSNTLEGENYYTFNQIAESVIQKSDNVGVGVILENIPIKKVEEVFYSIGVPYKDIYTEVELRVKDYAGFFRVLYNASYLNREMSEKLLEMLSKSEYRDGLVSGVPSDILVAHKFGERVIDDARQLHDCGIIYHPTNPYILCVMTKGDNFNNQELLISELSNYIYKEVDNNK